MPVEVSLQNWERELYIQRCWLHARAMYGCWIMHEKKRWLADRWLAVVIISQSAAAAVQRS